ncbi:MAG: ArsR family transcriptional regulator [Candidatus Lokiarchaeota archaeon]|nr:ArsR family transcriptional regulator [Candidatus Lokiarchaeota archaeon]
MSEKPNQIDKNSDERDVESSFYYALGHEIRRRIIKIIGDNEYTTFTNLKKELGVSTGAIYHHLETLKELVDQKTDKRYYLRELGVYAYSSLKNNIETIKSPDFTHRELRSPILRKLMKITSKRFIQFEKEDKALTTIISLSILITGTILTGLNGFYSFLLFFIESEQSNMDLFLQILLSFTFIINMIVFFIIIEGISRLFYKKKENTFNFFISFTIIQFPMVFYLITHLIFKSLWSLNVSVFNLLDKILLIIFQVWSLWLLSYSLCAMKGLKIESGLIISLLLHYGSFTIILFVLV